MSESSTQTPAGSQPRATRGFSQITIRMSDSLYDQMERARGGRSRNAYVVALIDDGVRVAGLPGQPRARAAKKTRARLEGKAARDAAGPEVTPEEEDQMSEGRPEPEAATPPDLAAIPGASEPDRVDPDGTVYVFGHETNGMVIANKLDGSPGVTVEREFWDTLPPAPASAPTSPRIGDDPFGGEG
jgi:hypothetical protein